jgi:hypothetical protein
MLLSKKRRDRKTETWKGVDTSISRPRYFGQLYRFRNNEVFMYKFTKWTVAYGIWGSHSRG